MDNLTLEELKIVKSLVSTELTEILKADFVNIEHVIKYGLLEQKLNKIIRGMK